MNDVCGIIRIGAAHEFLHDAACKFLAGEVRLDRLAPLLVRPRRATRHVEVRLAGPALRDLLRREVVDDDAVQCGVRRAEAEVYDAVLKRLRHVHGVVRDAEIALDIDLMRAVAVTCIVHVHVRDAALRRDRHEAAFVVLVDLDRAAALDVDGRAAAVCEHAVRGDLQIQIAVDIKMSARLDGIVGAGIDGADALVAHIAFAADRPAVRILHDDVAVHGEERIAGAVKTRRLADAVGFDIHRAVDDRHGFVGERAALDIDAVRAAVFVVDIDDDLVGRDLGPAGGRAAAVVLQKTASVAAERQRLSCGVDRYVLVHVDRRLTLLGRNPDGGIFRKGVFDFPGSLQYVRIDISLILGSVPRDRRSEIRHRLRLAIAAFSRTIVGDRTADLRRAGRGQSVRDHDRSCEILLAVCPSLVRQLAREGVQHIVNGILVVHHDAVVARRHRDGRVRRGTVDDRAPRRIMRILGAVATVLVEYKGMAAVAADVQGIRIPLLDDPPVRGIAAARKLHEAAAVNADTRRVAVVFIAPGRTVLQRELDRGALLCRDQSMQIGGLRRERRLDLPRAEYTTRCGNDVPVDLHLVRAGCPVRRVDGDETAPSLECISRLSLLVHGHPQPVEAKFAVARRDARADAAVRRMGVNFRHAGKVHVRTAHCCCNAHGLRHGGIASRIDVERQALRLDINSATRSRTDPPERSLPCVLRLHIHGKHMIFRFDFYGVTAGVNRTLAVILARVIQCAVLGKGIDARRLFHIRILVLVNIIGCDLRRKLRLVLLI